MKNFKFLLASFILLAVISCNNSNNTASTNESVKEEACSPEGCGSCSGCGKKEEVVTEQADTTVAKIMVYYFHGTRRCATCEAVEKVTEETINQNFLEGVGFVSINRENETELTKKFNISGQTLIVTKNDKVIDLTNEAFLNARSNPEKLTEKLSSVINSLL